MLGGYSLVKIAIRIDEALSRDSTLVPALLADQLDEPAGHDLALDGLAAAHAKLHELLVGRGAQGGDQDAAFAELGEERRGEGRGAGGDEDAVEGRLLGPAQGAVTNAIADVGAAL